MQSLELNRAYYRDCVGKTLEEHCSRIAERHAAALIGYGSEVLGNDDELSKRYGWGPRLLLFLTQEDHQAWAGKLHAIVQRHIPATFLGHPTRYTRTGPPQPTTDPTGDVGIAITTCERFAQLYLGLSYIDVQTNTPSSKDWLLLNEARLLRLTAGEVFHDGTGTLTNLREYFRYFPDDVWRHRLAYGWAALDRDITFIGTCAARGDVLSSRIAVARTVERIIAIVFLLNRTYKPGYLKWIHRQFHKLPHLANDIGSALDRLMTHKDCATASALLYPILDKIVEFQSESAGIPTVDYKRPRPFDDGLFDYWLAPVADSVRSTIQGELRDLRTTIGAVDQWISEQDLLMVPSRLSLLSPLYDCDDPFRVLFYRSRLEDKGIWDRPTTRSSGRREAGPGDDDDMDRMGQTIKASRCQQWVAEQVGRFRWRSVEWDFSQMPQHPSRIHSLLPLSGCSAPVLGGRRTRSVPAVKEPHHHRRCPVQVMTTGRLAFGQGPHYLRAERVSDKCDRAACKHVRRACVQTTELLVVGWGGRGRQQELICRLAGPPLGPES